jgi:hypothetical protein
MRRINPFSYLYNRPRLRQYYADVVAYLQCIHKISRTLGLHLVTNLHQRIYIPQSKKQDGMNHDWIELHGIAKFQR